MSETVKRKGRSDGHGEEIPGPTTGPGLHKRHSLYLPQAMSDPPVVIMVDNLPYGFFGKGKTAYMKAEIALAWFEKELTFMKSRKKRELYAAAIAKYKVILEDFRSGKMII